MTSPARTGSRAFAILAAAVVALSQAAVGASAAPTGAPPSTDTTQLTPSCPSLAASAPGPQTPLPSVQVAGPAAIGDLHQVGQKLITVEYSSKTLVTVDTADNSVTSRPLATTDAEPGKTAIDSTGAFYVLRYPFTIVKFDAGGQQVWSYTTSEPLLGLFVLGQGANARVGATFRDRAGAMMLTLAGAPVGELPIRGDGFAQTADGGLLATDRGRYVRSYDSTGTPTLVVGDQHVNNDPSPSGGPLHFYQLGGATRLPDGRMLVTDTLHGVMLLSPEGLLIGAVPPQQISSAGLTQLSNVVVIGDYVYLATGARFTNSQYVTRILLSDLLSRVRWDSAGSGSLGVGAGLSTPFQGNYVPPGATPVVRAVFDPWWGSVSGGLTLCWTIRNQDQLRTGDAGETGRLPGSQWSLGGTGTLLPLPTGLDPGAYKIDASLLNAGQLVSSTEMIMTIGAAGQRLSMSDLPPGADFGGPAPARGVALTDELGTRTFRYQLDWRRLLDSGTGQPLDFSYYDSSISAGSAEASRRGDTFIVQLGQGGPERALVDNSTWGTRVAEVVAHFKGVVHTWEAWNEPNLTYGSPADYVAKVLAPMYRAVKSVDPTATVVGGSACGVALDYWKGIVAAGGLDVMDVAGIHPYPGHNRSWEEQGSIPQLKELRKLLVRGGNPVPIWITELAWWSNGAANFLRQADDSSRALLWMAAIGIDKWAYFIPEGGWGNDGVTFSTIENDDFVKPSALALMTTTSELAGRRFLGEYALGVPSAYALRFGPRAGDPSSGELLVAWTDDVDLPFVLSGDTPTRPVLAVESLGATQQLSVAEPARLTLTGSPVFLAVQGAGQLFLKPTETFADDLAAASQGGSATASTSQSANPASRAVDGDAGAAGGGDLPGTPAWASQSTDPDPTLTVSLGHAQTIDRLIVSTHSIGSIVPGLRDYEVQVQADTSSAWQNVASIRGQFWERQKLVTFPPRTVSNIRVIVRSVNCTGTNESGVPPVYWGIDPAAPASALCGQAVITELAAFAPGGTTEARLPVAVTVTAPSSPQTIGGSFQIAALVRGLAGGVAGRPIALTRDGTVIATGTTSATGSWTVATTAVRPASYAVRVAGDAAYLPAASRTVAVHTVAHSRAVMQVARSFTRRGGAAVIVGRVTWGPRLTALPNASLQLWGRSARGWNLLAVHRTNSAGRASFSVRRVSSIRYYVVTFRGLSTTSAGWIRPSRSPSRAIRLV